ncbi:SusC/RagA family TonB-linked outer membrane protein [Sphingobacterium sp. SGL-16]|uniref:SusC/RagA family TonB-linked outer membrane protein n=1 Tax=Sphingobacterium sp. SGL-16 TaxID=2710883 RepID=UPI0013EDD214|nr:TonB-dependent receptor [Sphingobacterium sp. SGL-16]NGM74646.1 TonB-dependent receptor [Sphingobacterium sp. SGL-16]
MIPKSFLFICALPLLLGEIPIVKADSFGSHTIKWKQQPVRGKVTNEQGQPISGASVSVQGQSMVTSTDADGNFTINALIGQKLLIRHIGFQDQIVDVMEPNLKVYLSPENTELEEVIVVGYGTTNRRSVVGAVDQISSKAIENRPVANATQALQGASPSLNIQQRSMNPNDNTMNINIRGISTMNSNGPLLIIDGLVSEMGALNKLNPSDIESVSVLKDAGTAAIYGSRSANGVILVTTKGGKRNQRPSASISSLVGVQDAQILYAPVKGYQNATLKNMALTNVNQSPEFTPDQIMDLYNNQGKEVWNYNEIIQSALQQNHNITINGGGENSTYLFSAGHLDQRSNFVGNKDYGIKRYNLRSNLSVEYGVFKLSSILSYSRNNGLNTTASNAIINSSRIPPYYYYAMQAENGRYLVNNALTDQNPLAELREGGAIKHANDYMNANLALDVKLAKSLKLRGVFGADINADHRFIRRIQVPLYTSPDAEKPLVYVNSTRTTEDFNEKLSLLNYQLILDYDRTFGNHSIKGLFGATNESYTRRQNEIKLRFTDPILGTPTTGTEIDPTSRTTPNGTMETSINSLIGRLNYSYLDRYFIEGTFRYDGSSRFAKENRWGFFPSISAGWRLSEENFMEGYKDKVGDLKIRSSYGILGNQDIAPYQYLTIYSSYNNTYGFDNAAVAGAGFTYGNSDLLWEKTRNFNIGVDATFFQNKLSASFDYFHKHTTDILLTPEIPSVFGTTLSKTNIGKMNNQGWEVVLTYRGNTGNLRHNISANMGDSFNEVVYFQGKEQYASADRITKLIREGVPLNSYYGYKVKNYFQNIQEIETAALPVGISPTDLQPGDVRYEDRNNDGIIDSKDRYILGNGFPRYTFGLTYDLSYKNFDFSMFWQGVGKRDMMVRGELVEPFHENYSYTIYQHQLDFWTPTNIDAVWPRLTAAGATSTRNNYQMESDIYMFNGKYARLKNIQIGYSLPQSLVSKLRMERARLFVNAQNLLTLSLNSWIDPESSEFDSNMGGAANSARNYPTLKYYGFGLDIKF